jgi:chitinase
MMAAIRAALDMLTTTTGKQYGLTGIIDSFFFFWQCAGTKILYYQIPAAALPCNPQHIDNIEVSNLLSILTEWNLMSYDFFGAWDNVTGVSALVQVLMYNQNYWLSVILTLSCNTGVDSPLYPQGFGNDEFSSDRCVKNYNKLGVPKEKMSES